MFHAPMMQDRNDILKCVENVAEVSEESIQYVENLSDQVTDAGCYMTTIPDRQRLLHSHYNNQYAGSHTDIITVSYGVSDIAIISGCRSTYLAIIPLSYRGSCIATKLVRYGGLFLSIIPAC
jgi:hypothetical protein